MNPPHGQSPPPPPLPPYSAPPPPVMPYGDTRCPRCGHPGVKRVTFTWWGGLIGPKLLNHAKCDHCRFTFNAKTGQSNTAGIIIYTVVVAAIAGILGFVVFAGGMGC